MKSIILACALTFGSTTFAFAEMNNTFVSETMQIEETQATCYRIRDRFVYFKSGCAGKGGC